MVEVITKSNGEESFPKEKFYVKSLILCLQNDSDEKIITALYELYGKSRYNYLFRQHLLNYDYKEFCETSDDSEKIDSLYLFGKVVEKISPKHSLELNISVLTVLRSWSKFSSIRVFLCKTNILALIMNLLNNIVNLSEIEALVGEKEIKVLIASVATFWNLSLCPVAEKKLYDSEITKFIYKVFQYHPSMELKHQCAGYLWSISINASMWTIDYCKSFEPNIISVMADILHKASTNSKLIVCILGVALTLSNNFYYLEKANANFFRQIVNVAREKTSSITSSTNRLEGLVSQLEQKLILYQLNMEDE